MYRDSGGREILSRLVGVDNSGIVEASDAELTKATVRYYVRASAGQRDLWKKDGVHQLRCGNSLSQNTN